MAVASKQGNQLTHRWLFFRILMNTLIWTPPLQMHSNGTSDPLDMYVCVCDIWIRSRNHNMWKSKGTFERWKEWVLLKSQTHHFLQIVHDSRLQARSPMLMDQTSWCIRSQPTEPGCVDAKTATTQPFSEDISSSPEIAFCICKSNSQYHKQKQHYSKQFKCTWNQSKTTESIAEHQLVDPSIFTLASDSGCFLVLSSCVICVPVCDKHNPKAHKAMRPHKHYRPTNKISAYPYESQCHFCIHSVHASQRAQTGIVWNCAISSVGGRTTETQSNSVTEQTSEKFTLLLVLAQAIR